MSEQQMLTINSQTVDDYYQNNLPEWELDYDSLVTIWTLANNGIYYKNWYDLLSKADIPVDLQDFYPDPGYEFCYCDMTVKDYCARYFSTQDVFDEQMYYEEYVTYIFSQIDGKRSSWNEYL